MLELCLAAPVAFADAAVEFKVGALERDTQTAVDLIMQPQLRVPQVAAVLLQ